MSCNILWHILMIIVKRIFICIRITVICDFNILLWLIFYLCYSLLFEQPNTVNKELRFLTCCLGPVVVQQNPLDALEAKLGPQSGRPQSPVGSRDQPQRRRLPGRPRKRRKRRQTPDSEEEFRKFVQGLQAPHSDISEGTKGTNRSARVGDAWSVCLFSICCGNYFLWILYTIWEDVTCCL